MKQQSDRVVETHPAPASARRPLGVVRSGDVSPGRPTELVLVAGPGLGARFRLAGAELFIGRAEGSDLRLEDPRVAAEHVRLLREGDDWVAQDLSGSGVHVNDERVSDYTLRDGDRLRVGRTVLRLLAAGNLEDRYREEVFRASVVDGITRLWTRRAFEDALQCEARRTRRTGHPLSAVVLTLEGFDEDASDDVLRLAGSRLKVALQRQDRIARLGSRQVGVLLPGHGPAGLPRLAEQLRDALQGLPFPLDARDVAVRVEVLTASLAGDESENVLLSRLGVQGGIGPLPEVLLRGEEDDEG
jgi:diguanylate cyclase (GGDEF)-like protein